MHEHLEMNSCCPACRSARKSAPLYELPDVPVQSVRLFDSPNAARQCESGALVIVQCLQCGLLFNSAFDQETQVWDVDYEETQDTSAYFRQFAEDLSHQLIDHWQLRNKRVLEVGCGKGYFLSTLCRAGGNIGLGVDPSHDMARSDTNSKAVTFCAERLQPEHLEFAPDLIVCRHTLEHLLRPDDVLSIMAARSDIPVFIDVPAVDRILQEGAFWDVYYEHCNYFDRQSLTALLERFGILAEKIALGFGHHYLMYFGRTGAATADHVSCVVAEKSMKHIDRMRHKWVRQLRKWADRGEKAVLWGGGSKAVAFLSGVGSNTGNAVRAAVDINPVKQGRFLPGSGLPVLAPENLVPAPPDHVVILNPVYHSEIEEHLKKLQVNTRLTDVSRISV